MKLYIIKIINLPYLTSYLNLITQLEGDTNISDYLDYIKRFPLNDDPELFGLHANADITCAQSQTYNCLATLLKLQPKQVGGAAASQEEVTANAAKQILDNLPAEFDLQAISEKHECITIK